MDLKKLYKDITVLCGRELPVYTFLTLCDMCAGALLCRYPKNIVVGKGEYITPENLESSFSVDSAFYTAVVCHIIGSINNDGEKLKQSETEAEKAYLSLWKRAAHGKRKKCDRW